MPLIQQITAENDSIADLLNKADKTSQRWLLHRAGKSRGGEGTGGVTWADKRETAVDMLKGYHQVVGHTPVKDIETIRYADSSVTYIDVLDTKTYFHVEIL